MKNSLKTNNPLLQSLQPYAHRRVVLGVSGGADSVAMLRCLVMVGAHVHVAHLDHSLRDVSAEDAAWVEQLCHSLDVPYHGSRVNVAHVAAQRGWNLEDAARRVRYDFLGRVARQSQAETILIAHTLRDQAETVLTQLLRGEAVLQGITSTQRRQRPWLHISRQQIEDFLHEIGQSWREDESNTDTSLNRVWLRCVVIPLLQTRYPALEKTLSRLARWQKEDHEALSQASHLTEHAPWTKREPAVLRRAVVRLLQEAKHSYHAEHIDQLVSAIKQQKTTHITLPQGQTVSVTAGKVFIQPRTYHPPTFEYPASWTLRHRKPGDTMRLSFGTKKLSDILIDRHIPRRERDQIFLLAEESQVKWLGLVPSLTAHDVSLFDPIQDGMQAALEQAKQAAALLEVPVGAVILNKDGQIIAAAHNACRQSGNMTLHAEIRAMNQAVLSEGAYLSDCTLIVTLEPCMMCLGAALEARIGHIVYGAHNPKSGALGGVRDLLQDHWGWMPTVTAGVMARECGQLLSGTFQRIRSSKTERSACSPSIVPHCDE